MLDRVLKKHLKLKGLEARVARLVYLRWEHLHVSFGDVCVLNLKTGNANM